MIVVGIDRDRGEPVDRDLVHLELAVVERHAPNGIVGHPAGNASAFLHPFLVKGGAAGDSEALGHPVCQAHSGPAVVRMPRHPVAAVLEEETVAFTEVLEKWSFVGELEDERLAGGHRPGQHDADPRLVQIVIHPPVVLELDEVHRFAIKFDRLVTLSRFAGQQRDATDILDPVRRERLPPDVLYLEYR